MHSIMYFSDANPERFHTDPDPTFYFTLLKLENILNKLLQNLTKLALCNFPSNIYLIGKKHIYYFLEWRRMRDVE